MAIVDELVAQLSFDLKGERNLSRFNKGLKNAERNAMAVAGAIGRIAGAATLAAAAGMVSLGKSVISTSADFEQFESTLTIIEGSAAKAKESMSWITDFAAKTPFDVKGITDSFVKLKAYGLDPIADDTLRVLGDTASAMGKPLNQAVEAFADASTMEFERLKEFGLKAKQTAKEVTFTWSKNGKDLSRTLKKDGAEIRKFIIENLGERFAGAMDLQSRTWKGMMSNIGDSWDLFKKKIGDKGFFDVAKGVLKGVLDQINLLDKDGTLDEWAKGLSDALTTGLKAGVGLAKGWIADFTALKDLLSDFPDVKVAVLSTLGAIGAYVFPKTAALLVLNDIFSSLTQNRGVIADFGAELAKFTGDDASGFVLAISSIIGIVGTIAVVTGKFKLFAASLFAVAAGMTAVKEAGGIEAARNKLMSGYQKYVSGVRSSIAKKKNEIAERKALNFNRPIQRAEKGDRLPSLGRMKHIDPSRFGAGGAAQISNDNNSVNTVNSTVTIHQNVTTAVQAPGAAASATGAAVSKAVNDRAGVTQGAQHP